MFRESAGNVGVASVSNLHYISGKTISDIMLHQAKFTAIVFLWTSCLFEMKFGALLKIIVDLLRTSESEID